jgi:hypothetical protein
MSIWWWCSLRVICYFNAKFTFFFEKSGGGNLAIPGDFQNAFVMPDYKARRRLC